MAQNITTDINMTNPTSIETFAAALSILLLSSWAMTVYLLVLVVILRHLNYFDNSFYRYLISLGISDCLTLTIFILYVVPTTLSQTRPFGDSVDQFIGFLSIFAWYTGLLCISCIAVNRYWAVCRNETLYDVFNAKHVNYSLVFVWVFGLIFALPSTTPLAPFRYNYEEFSFFWDVTHWLGKLYIYRWEPSVTIFTCTVLVCSYGLILIEMRKQTMTVEDSISNFEMTLRQRREVKLALQFLGVGVYLLIFDIVFLSMPNFTLYRWHLFLLSLMWIINCAINPFIYLTTSSQIRDKVFTAIGFASDSHVTQNNDVHLALNEIPGTLNNGPASTKRLANRRPTLAAAKVIAQHQ